MYDSFLAEYIQHFQVASLKLWDKLYYYYFILFAIKDQLLFEIEKNAVDTLTKK